MFVVSNKIHDGRTHSAERAEETTRTFPLTQYLTLTAQVRLKSYIWIRLYSFLYLQLKIVYFSLLRYKDVNFTFSVGLEIVTFSHEV